MWKNNCKKCKQGKKDEADEGVNKEEREVEKKNAEGENWSKKVNNWH